MSSPDNSVCPGVGGRKCGMFMSPAFKDPHPTCARCRGRKCSIDSPCSDCHNWSLEQRESYNKRRSYTESNRPPSRHSGNPTAPIANTPSPASKPVASSPTPLPHSAPPSLGGVGDSKHVCPPLPPCPLASKERGGGGTDMELAGNGSTPPLPLPSEGGRMDPSPPQPSRIVTKASISPRPNSHNSHSYPPRSDSWSERGENRIYSHAPFPTPLHSIGFEREMPGDRSRAALNQQGFHGPHPIPVDRLRSRGNDRHSPPRYPLPARDRCGSSSSPRSGSVESKRFITKALRGTTGNDRSPMSNNSSPMPMLTSTGRSTVHTTPHGLGTHYCSPRSQDPLYHTGQYTERDHQAWQSYSSPGTVYTSPWASYGHQSARPAPVWYQPGQPSPGHHWGTLQQWDYASSRPNWHGSSPQAQALAGENANGSGRGASTSLPPAGNPTMV